MSRDAFAREVAALDLVENVLEHCVHDIGQNDLKVKFYELQEAIIAYRSDIIDAKQIAVNAARAAEMNAAQPEVAR